MTNLMGKPNNTGMVFNALDRYAISIMSLPVLKDTQKRLTRLLKKNKADMSKMQSRFEKVQTEVEAIKRDLVKMESADLPQHKLDNQREKLRSKQEQSLAVFQEKSQVKTFGQEVDNELEVVSRRIITVEAVEAKASLNKNQVGSGEVFLELTFDK